MQGRELLIALAIKNNFDFDLIFKDIKARTKITDDYCKECLDKLNNSGYKALTIIDKDYPDSLKRTKNPPIVLFYKGDLSLIKDNKPKKSLYVITNKDSDYGKTITDKVVKDFDIIKRTTKKEFLGGCKINDNLFIYEYIPNLVDLTPNIVSLSHRIASGLCNNIYVASMKKHSGFNLSVMFALTLGKNVYVLPHSVDDVDDECNTLIANGSIALASYTTGDIA